MKIVFLASLIVFTTLILGCKEETNPVAKYANNLISVYEGSKIEAEQATLKSIQRAIQMYRAANGEYPETLEDIQDIMDSPIDTGLYEYNPEDGTVTLKK